MVTKSWSSEAANQLLLQLSPEEQVKVVEYGALLRLADLRQQLFTAQSHVKEMSAKYHTTLEELERAGLPDDAGWEMHEDFILWHHYAERIKQIEKNIAVLEEGLRPTATVSHAR